MAGGLHTFELWVAYRRDAILAGPAGEDVTDGHRALAEVRLPPSGGGVTLTLESGVEDDEEFAPLNVKAGVVAELASVTAGAAATRSLDGEATDVPPLEQATPTTATTATADANLVNLDPLRNNATSQPLGLSSVRLYSISWMRVVSLGCNQHTRNTNCPVRFVNRQAYRVENRTGAPRIILTVEIGFTILKGHASDSPEATVTCKIPGNWF